MTTEPRTIGLYMRRYEDIADGAELDALKRYDAAYNGHPSNRIKAGDTVEFRMLADGTVKCGGAVYSLLDDLSVVPAPVSPKPARKRSA